MRLAGKAAVITGGGSGIGRATALLFAREGASVMVAGRRGPALEETAAMIAAAGGRAATCQTDVARGEDVAKLMAKAAKAFGKIDILFSNAGVFTGIGKTVEELPEAEWDELMSVNLRGCYLCARHAVPYLRKSGGGSIVNCSSISGHIGQPRQGAYNAAKGGIELLTKSMALDFAPDRIRVNTVCPAWVIVDFNKDDYARRGPEIDALHPLGRAGTPMDVAYAVLFLASDEASWITGTSLMVDGGYTAR